MDQFSKMFAIATYHTPMGVCFLKNLVSARVNMPVISDEVMAKSTGLPGSSSFVLSVRNAMLGFVPIERMADQFSQRLIGG